MLSIIGENGETLIEKGLVKIFVSGPLPIQRSIDLGMSAAQCKEVKITN